MSFSTLVTGMVQRSAHALGESVKALVEKTPRMGHIDDSLAGLSLPAREDLGISLERLTPHPTYAFSARAIEVNPSCYTSVSPLVKVVVRDGELRGSVLVQEREARELHASFKEQTSLFGVVREIPTELRKKLS